MASAFWMFLIALTLHQILFFTLVNGQKGEFNFYGEFLSECTDDNQCDDDYNCINGICTRGEGGCHPMCREGEVCQNGACRREEPEEEEEQSSGGGDGHPPPRPTSKPRKVKPKRGDYDGWKYNKNNGYYYYVGIGSYTYPQAVSYCMSANAKVVWFNQSTFMTFQNEMMWVNMIATSSGIRTYWIGAKKMFPGGDLKAGWIWTNDEPLKYFNWRRGQPDGCCGGDVTCVLVNYHDSSGVWEDGGCNRIWRNPQGFVCKKEGPEDES